ncbi:ABC transporter ATP-binding protein [Paraburkholderia phenazinium]|jgi:lipopolysaccharide transport system ATP-binding protein|uniref:Lipopolysaccharide transport system ATP-binding protein n=1 Tax=Paraburkholderia phenazinium TaxID=60549 RepID=A0A1N6LGL7_9BURK|nr:ABC transporter ATP-binding protein [Paraburkholderia phenazinium]SIO67960.1 lipopolysaccharide transport system ATP-binding protein [Paraburkholderia phenazinium]
MCSDSVKETAVEVHGLGKRYEIYSAPQDRLKQMMLPRLARMVGRQPKEYFREFWALRDVDLTVNRGETVAIIGQNGSGKSTFLQLVCGTLFPTQGEVKRNGRIAALLELGAGFNPDFTGEENVYLSGMLYGLTEKQLKERYKSIIEFAEIGDFVSQPVKTYSSGMYVRLAFAIAAHVDADVLVVDEALSVGDVRFTQKCMRFLREFQKNGTLLFVSHDVGAVTSLCSRAVWLDHGSVRMDGSAKEVVEAYLAEQHVLDRKAQGVAVSAVKTARARAKMKAQDVIDPRLDQLKAANTIKVFEFDPEVQESAFGAGGASIVDVALIDEDGRQTQLMQGGELVTLQLKVEVHAELAGLIFGFYVKDRLGQRLFGDNSHLSYEDLIDGGAGDVFLASFRFRMPILPVGAYSIDAAVASGTQDDHTQQHWLHDALQFRTVDSTMRHGLIGIPMLSISVEKERSLA